MVVYHNTSNWDERIDLMLNLREVADRYEDLKASVWEVNGMFVDQMLSLKYLTYYVGFLFKLHHPCLERDSNDWLYDSPLRVLHQSMLLDLFGCSIGCQVSIAVLSVLSPIQ